MFKRFNSSIPIIDFHKFLKGSSVDKHFIANQVLDGFRTVGFIYLANHGIPNYTVDDVFKQSKSFFQRPEIEKQALAWETPESNRGYVSPGREKVTQLTSKEQVQALKNYSPDIKESFEIGKEGSPKYKNRWPHDIEFKKTMVDFYQKCFVLHLHVMDSLAIGLGLGPGFFEPYCDAQDNNLRLLHYPKVEKSILDREGQTRAGAHTDYGTITLLFQDERSGLQVKNPSGQFVDAPPIKDTIVINAGDLLQRWSNDLIRSTDHRVVSPESNDGEYYPERYSIAYFCNPNQDATIKCLDVCHSSSNPPKYPPVNAFSYLTQRLATTYF